MRINYEGPYRERRGLRQELRAYIVIAKIIAITDKGLSPLVSLADIRFEVEEAHIKGIRSLTATTCLAVALVLALGHRLEAAALKRQPAVRSKR